MTLKPILSYPNISGFGNHIPRALKKWKKPCLFSFSFKNNFERSVFGRMAIRLHSKEDC